MSGINDEPAPSKGVVFVVEDPKPGTPQAMQDGLYRVGFQVTDAWLTGAAKAALMRWVYEGAEVRLTGGYADGSGPDAMPAEVDSSPGLGGPLMPPRPKPPQ